MSEEEQAKETVAGWLGHRPQREVLVAILVAPVITAQAQKAMGEAEHIKYIHNNIEKAIDWADVIIDECRKRPPP